ncbi:MAG: hypothetical protein GX361_04800 [Bacteroidales bacterium]|nr:hypothetical protein [Bacteroidales bacterium]
MKNIRVNILLILLFASFFSIQAQHGIRKRNFDVTTFHEKKWNFMMSKVALSPAEINAVKPIFMEYEKKNWELHKQIRQLFRQTRNGNMTEKDYRELNDKMINNELKRSQYLREYHLKLRKLLNAETLFNYYRAEKSFERQLLNKRLQKRKRPAK